MLTLSLLHYYCYRRSCSMGYIGSISESSESDNFSGRSTSTSKTNSRYFSANNWMSRSKILRWGVYENII